MHPFTDTGLVVRTYDLGEADRIVTLLTQEHGLVRGKADAKAVAPAECRCGDGRHAVVEQVQRELAVVSAETLH